MPVLLSTTDRAASVAGWTRWIATGAAIPALPPDAEVADAARQLEAAFDAAYAPWLATARKLQADPSAQLAHMPTLSTYASDYGLMLAWVDLVGVLGTAAEPTLVCCDDPWLFRALSTLPGVTAGPPPPLMPARLKNALRGVLARAKVVARLTLAYIRTRHHRQRPARHKSYILVYGHPESRADGHDAYFGESMLHFPTLRRVMHTDCGVAFARKLGGDGRTVSLHAWGSLRRLPALLFTRWTPSLDGLSDVETHLVARAASLEGRGGSAAMTRWQRICQRTWLIETQPRSVAWPWENHPWERDFTVRARSVGTRTVAYQHTVVGRHMFNQGAESNKAGLDEIPDIIALNGPRYGADLAARGIPANRMVVAGAHRMSGARHLRYDPKGPVFIALSNHPGFARQMIDAFRPLSGAQRDFLAKDHPLSPYPFDSSVHFKRTALPFERLPALSAFIYCTGTSGLESALAGIPTLRFIPKGGVALDILPGGVNIPPVTAEGAATGLATVPIPDIGTADDVFPVPDRSVWGDLFDVEHKLGKTS